jgi:FkbM family methyltransferase
LWKNNALAGSPGSRTLYITRSESNTSLLPPNRALLDSLQYNAVGGAEGHDVIRTIEVDCETLDAAVADLDSVDFLKLDTQGSELEILHGGPRTLANSVMVEVEVEFAPVYEAQPLFGQVDAFLRGQDFILLDLGRLLHVKPSGVNRFIAPKGRLIDCDALYVRDFFERLDPIYENRRKLAAGVVGLLAYGFVDLAAALVDRVLGAERDPDLVRLRDCLMRARHSSSLLPSIVRRGDLMSRVLRRLAMATYGERHFYRSEPIGNRDIRRVP